MTTDANERLLTHSESVVSLDANDEQGQHKLPRFQGSNREYTNGASHIRSSSVSSRSSSSSSGDISSSHYQEQQSSMSMSPFSHSMDSIVAKASHQHMLANVKNMKLAKWLSTIITSTANFSVSYNFSAVSIALVIMSAAECTSSAEGMHVHMVLWGEYSGVYACVHVLCPVSCALIPNSTHPCPSSVSSFSAPSLLLPFSLSSPSLLLSPPPSIPCTCASADCKQGHQAPWVGSAATATVFAGAIAGQLIMGYAGDVLGRNRAMTITLLLATIAAALSAILPPTSGSDDQGNAATVYGVIIACRFVLGIGLGGTCNWWTYV